MSRLLATVLLAVALPACSNPPAPTPPSPPVRFPDLKMMAGTCTSPSTWTTVAARCRRRRGAASTERRSKIADGTIFVVSIVGGGFSEAPQVCDLFSGELGAVQRYDRRLQWNSFDLTCDVREPLVDGGELAVCGEGPIARSESVLSAAVKGYAFVSRETQL